DRTKEDFLWSALRLAAVHFYFWLQLLSRTMPSPMAPAGLRRHRPPRAVSSTHKNVLCATARNCKARARACVEGYAIRRAMEQQEALRTVQLRPQQYAARCRRFGAEPGIRGHRCVHSRAGCFARG